MAIRATRDFFKTHDILEVMTPKAVTSPALEPYIDAVRLEASQTQETLSLATSPEFALKKNFASELATNTTARGIYEIAPVFRDDRPGKNHGIEFTMIEWYIKETSLQEILAMAGELIAMLSETGAGTKIHPRIEVLDLAALFAEAGCVFDFTTEAGAIEKYQLLHGSLPAHLNRMDAAIVCFNLLFDEFALPRLKQAPGLAAVSGYPDYLGALAYTEKGISQRAEIFYNGLELANGYREEYRAHVARERWQRYNTIRELRGVKPHAVYEELIEILPHMQGVAGIAVGLERVLQVLFPGTEIRRFFS